MSLASFKQLFVGAGNSNSSIDGTEAKKAFRRLLSVITGAATVTAEVAETFVCVAPFNCKIISGYWAQRGTTLAADATSYAKTVLYKKGTDGSTTTGILSVSSASTAFTDSVSRAMTLTAANALVYQGETLCYAIRKSETTTGGSVYAGAMGVEIEETD